MQGANIASPLLTASIQYILNVLLTLPAILFLDRLGRRPSMLIGSFLMMTCLLIVGILQATYGQPISHTPTSDTTTDSITWVIPPNNATVSKAIVALTYLFVCTFATTWGPTSWTYPSEIYPTRIRAKAVSIATATNWFFNCILAFAVPPLLYNINWKMYIIFALFNACAFVHMFLAAPETKGVSLEEMDNVFDSGVPAWRSRRAVRRGRLECGSEDAEREVKVGKGGARKYVEMEEFGEHEHVEIRKGVI